MTAGSVRHCQILFARLSNQSAVEPASDYSRTAWSAGGRPTGALFVLISLVLGRAREETLCRGLGVADRRDAAQAS